MSVDHATDPTLLGLRRTRAMHQKLLRRIRLVAPLLLAVYVLSAYQAQPGPGLSGRSLAVSLAVAGYLAGILVVLSLLDLADGPSSAWLLRSTWVVGIDGAVVLASAVTLFCLQPKGPGAEGAFLGVLFFARQLPYRIGLLLSLVAFVVLEVAVGFSGQGLGGLTILAAVAACYGLLFLAARLREANEQAEQLVIELERSRAAETRAAGLAERQHLAREMHDVLAHSLSGLLLQLEGARMLAAEDPSDPRLPEVIDRAHHLGRTGLEEARRAIGMLRDEELPGPELLAGLAAEFEGDRGIPCVLTVSGEEHELGSEARLALYRVAQEALTNITRHAQPRRVELHLAYEPDGTRLSVEDFVTEVGVGALVGGGPRSSEAEVVQAGSDGGYGLTGMRERAELLGGTLVTEATARGFRVELEVPA